MSVLEEYLELVRAATAEIESLRSRLAEAEADRDAGWKTFYALREQVGKDRYPGLTNIVRATASTSGPKCERCGDTGWIQGDPVIGIADEPCGCDDRECECPVEGHAPGCPNDFFTKAANKSR